MSTGFASAGEFLMAGGVTSAKFETPGTTVHGKIARPPEVQQQREIDSGKPKFWEDGKPRLQIVAHVQTTDRDPEIEDDDGVRAIYIRGNMLRAVREAVRKAGCTDLAVGAELAVTYTGDGQRTRSGYNPPKLYSAVYTPASGGDMAAALGVTQPQTAPAAQQQQQVPSAVAKYAAMGLSPEQVAAVMALQDKAPY